MQNKVGSWLIGLIIYAIVEILSIVACYLWLKDLFDIFLLIFLVGNGALAVVTLISYQRDRRQRVLAISQILGKEGQEVLQIGRLGLMTYDDDYIITWTSELFDEYQKSLISQKLLKAIPGLRVLFNGEADEVEVEYEGSIYKVIRKDNAQILFWQDITAIANLRNEYQENRVVLGMVHMDNYADIAQAENEQVIATMNANVRQPIVEWAKDNNIMIRRLRSDRFIIILNEKKYQELEEEYFPLLDSIREEAQKVNVDITLSMVFARGTNDIRVLNDMVNNLTELALSRGGDQVIMRSYQKEIKYFGGTSEATEKTSKVKARVLASSIRELIEKSPRVFIVGHLDIDFDCMGSMLAMSKMAQLYCREVYVLTEDVSIDNQLQEALLRFWDSIADKHNFISESDALLKAEEEDLVICIDHHHLGLCSTPELVNEVKKMIVIDHHRRGESFYVRPTLVYVEASASSSSELVIELLEYQMKTINLEAFEATLMLAGIIVDTNHFRVRSSSRTFEAAGLLKVKGADSSEAEAFLKDSFDDFENKNRIYSYAKIINDTTLVASVNDDRIYNRGIIAQAADDLLDVKNIETAYVIAKSGASSFNISARSRGIINVQVVMEKMDGGGHFSAAGLQRENTSVKKLEEELLQVLKEGRNESNLIN